MKQVKKLENTTTETKSISDAKAKKTTKSKSKLTTKTNSKAKTTSRTKSKVTNSDAKSKDAKASKSKKRINANKVDANTKKRVQRHGQTKNNRSKVSTSIKRNKWDNSYVRTSSDDNVMIAQSLLKYHKNNSDIVHFPQQWCNGWISAKDFPLDSSECHAKFILLHSTITNIIRSSLMHGMSYAIKQLEAIVNGN